MHYTHRRLSMSQKNLWKKSERTKEAAKQVPEKEKTYPRPAWVPKGVSSEEELCPDCFKVVGTKSRYKLVCMLGKSKSGLTVGAMTKAIALRQPTVSHHLQALLSVDAVLRQEHGRECIYTLNRTAHCFEECKIPY
jgi:DNA-binding transcriptional ArsR family regulator